MKYINDWLPWVSVVVIFIAGKISSYYQYAKKADPDMAQKIKHVGELATWAVSYQSKFETKTGSQKFDDAVNAVEAQVSSNIDRETIKGAVQNAYLNSDLSAPVQDTPAKSAEKAAQSTADLDIPPAEPIQEDNDEL